jgi:hypothetical protein
VSTLEANPVIGRKRIQRRAAPAVEIPISRDELEGLMARISFDEAALALAHALELDTADMTNAPRRLGIFHEAFKIAPLLQRAAASRDVPRMRQEWANYARQQAQNPRFWHAVAMLLRERMIYSRQNWTAAQSECLTALWVGLFCSKAFWEYFSAAEPKPTPEEAWELFTWTVTEWLTSRRVEAETALVRSEGDAALCHIRSLKTVLAGENPIREILHRAGWEISMSLDKDRLQFAQETTTRLMAELNGTALMEAERKLGGKDSKDEPRFSDAIATLEKYLKAGGDSLPILAAILDWHIQWAEAKARGESDAPQMATGANAVATKLALLTEPGDALRKENVLLATFHSHLAGAAHDIKERLKHAEMSLKWNPGLLNAQAISAVSQVKLESTHQGVLKVLQKCQERGFDPGLLRDIREKVEGRS